MKDENSTSDLQSMRWRLSIKSHLKFQQFWKILKVAEYLSDFKDYRMIIKWLLKRTESRMLEGEKITTKIQVIFAVYCNNLVLSLWFSQSSSSSHSIVKWKRKMLHKLNLILQFWECTNCCDRTSQSWESFMSLSVWFTWTCLSKLSVAISHDTLKDLYLWRFLSLRYLCFLFEQKRQM